MGYAEEIKFSPGEIKGKRERKPICPKCKERKKHNSGPYCLECMAEYMRERRKDNPELKKQATEYKREYRRLKKMEAGR